MDKDRLAVLIGKSGKTKKLIEKLTNTRIEINSDTGSYNIFADKKNQEKTEDDNDNISLEETIEDLELDTKLLKSIESEPIFSVWITKSIVEAINVGFNPRKAMKLLDQEYTIEVFHLERNLGISEKDIKRIAGRIIGKNGRMREAIEQYSKAFISIIPNKRTVALIGDFDSLKVARKAVHMISEGLPHNTVYKFLQKRSRERKDQEFRKTWKPTFDF